MAQGERRASLLLAAGMVAGMAAAGWSVMRGDTALPDGAVARVNERIVTREDWQRAVAAVASGRRTPLTEDDRRLILGRLVDEELLAQHGLRLGLMERDRRLRNQLVADVIAAAAAAAPDPDEPALRAYYESHREYFAAPGRLRVRVVRRDGVPFSPPVPDVLMPPAKLREYLGPRLTEAALSLAPGASHEAGEITLTLLEREPADVPAFERVRAEVHAAARRAAEEEALRALLEALRGEARVVVQDVGR